MTDTNKRSFRQWTKQQAAILASICLFAGIAGGWTIRASQSPSAPAQVAHLAPTASAAPQPPTPVQLKQMADAQAAPLLNRLKAEPKNPELLAAIGNLYYDAQQYPDAVSYYQRTLEIKPADADVRTDLGTALWFMGNADSAITAFNTALTSAPNNPNTLFNRGLVKWRGKKDGIGALADWDKLLAANPAYAQKDAVEKMIAEVKNQPASSTATAAK